MSPSFNPLMSGQVPQSPGKRAEFEGVSDGAVFWGGFSGLAGLWLCDYWLLAP